MSNLSFSVLIFMYLSLSHMQTNTLVFITITYWDVFEIQHFVVESLTVDDRVRCDHTTIIMIASSWKVRYKIKCRTSLNTQQTEVQRWCHQCSSCSVIMVTANKSSCRQTGDQTLDPAAAERHTDVEMWALYQQMNINGFTDIKLISASTAQFLQWWFVLVSSRFSLAVVVHWTKL